MSLEQPELLPTPPVLPAGLPDEPDVRRLWLLLAQRRDWTTRAVIVEQVRFESGIVWGERLVRQLAEKAMPHVISGHRGYRARQCADPDEIRGFVLWMESMSASTAEHARAVRSACPELFSNL